MAGPLFFYNPGRMAYDWKSIETKWQAAWRRSGIDKAPERPDPGRKQYVLIMFPYPSGDLHVGHLRNYTIGDVVARHGRMNGRQTVYPMGWDAFGMPAEQAAIKHGIHPGEWTRGNIRLSKQTLERVAFSIDWDREVTTCEPDYYKWTQWLFLVMHRQGLTERRRSLVNWCDTCHTVLANEQVSTGGCWRCGNPVGKKELEQWYFRMSSYAERLLKDIDDLTQWPESTKAMQRHWIGRSEGAEIHFEVKGKPLTVFTTRPDTLFGATYVVLAPEHPLVEAIADPARLPELRAYREKAQNTKEIDRLSTVREKTGVFTGAYAVNPATKQEVPVWVADYVLTGYGTGAIMAVPAHDPRDFAFAKAHGLPVVEVIQGGEVAKEAYEGPGVLVNSAFFDGMPHDKAKAEITAWLAKEGKAVPKVQYRLKDWLVSRQRFWGAPIPVIHCPACGPVPVPEKDLPVRLPEGVKDFLPKGRSPLADVPAFVDTACPSCGAKAQRDTDTMDTFLCSSWYLFRYADARNADRAFRRELVDAWCPVDVYIGGAEHACMHLLYFRFVTKVLKDAGFVGFEEPVKRLFHQGMIHGENGEVMSKSKGNAVAAGPFIDRVGVDTARVALLFFAPSGDDIRWSEDGVKGAWRFLNRFWEAMEPRAPQVRTFAGQAVQVPALSPAAREVRRRLHAAIQRTSEAFERDYEFNTAIAALMEFLNAFTHPDQALGDDPADGPVVAEACLAVVRLIAPMAPHLAEELWERFGQKGSVLMADWPKADPAALVMDEVELAVQVNGKVKGRITVPSKATEEEVRKAALAHPAVAGKPVKMVKVVPGRLVNIVVVEGAKA